MRKFVLIAVAAAGMCSASQANAAAVPGFEALYTANFNACVLPNGTLADCEAAINAHVAALVSGNTDQALATASFQSLRAEVFATNAPDEDFQAAIDALFELLLPESGAIAAPIDTGTPASLTDTGSGPEPVEGSNS